jgi:hypothetical protein
MLSGDLNEEQAKVLLNQGIASTNNSKKSLPMINSVLQGKSLTAPQIGVDAKNNPIYGFDKKNNPITEPPVIYGANDKKNLDVAGTYLPSQAQDNAVETAVTGNPLSGAGMNNPSTTNKMLGSQSINEPSHIAHDTGGYNATQNTMGNSNTQGSSRNNQNAMGSDAYIAPVFKGNPTDAQANADFADRKSAYDLLYSEFSQYGLGALVTPLKTLIMNGTSPSELAIRLRETPVYKQRFAGNAARIANGLRAMSESEYIRTEDAYQNIMRNYGLPASYYAKDSIGTQAGFTNLIGSDVSAAELEDRVATAQNRVINANPEITQALKAFYPDITNGDILAYTLDPTKAIDMIKRKVTAAEIGGAALSSGLTTSAAAAENLAKYGINAAQAQQGYGQIAGMLPRASQLSDIYGQGAYNQATAEAATFGIAGATEAIKKTKKLSELEQASFSGQSGTSGNALNRDRTMSQMQYSSPGAGAF